MSQATLWNDHWFNKAATKSARGALLFAGFCIPISVSLQNLGFVLLCLLALVLVGTDWRDKINYIIKNPLSKWIMLLYLFILIGIFYTNADGHWLCKVVGEQSYFLGFFLILLVLYRAKLTLFAKALNAYVLGCMVVFLIAVLGDFNLLPKISWFNHAPPYYAFFKIYGALFMAFGGFIVLQLLKFSKMMKWRIIYSICFIAITYNVVWMSFSRSGYIIYVLLLLLFALQITNKRYRIGAILAIVVAIIIMFVVSQNMQQGLKRVATSTKAFQQMHKDDTSAGLRLQFAKNSIKLWRKKPIIGYGTGGFLKAYVDIHGISAGVVPSTMQHPQHDPEGTYTFILVEHGLLGLLMVLALYGAQIRRAFMMEKGMQRDLAQGFILLIVIFSFGGNLLLGNSTMVFYVFFSALLFASYEKTSSKL